ncbi:MAG: hypothetical protein GF309_06595 [Candidatus Lokiarchaeota archaeon]|nr:hypothetical protein [Candidatus Lokiarchaeota archaeon]
MRRRLKEYKATVELVMDSFFHFPLVEVLTGAFIVIAAYFITGTHLGNSFIVPSILGPDYTIEEMNNTLTRSGMLTLGSTLSNFSFLLAFILPPIIAYSVGRAMETGILRTYLSFPLSKENFLSAIVSIIVGALVVPVIAISLAGTWIFETNLGQVEMATAFSLGFLGFALLCISSSIVLALVSNNTMVTSLLGTGMWLGLLILSRYTPVESPLLDPISFGMQYLAGVDQAPTLLEVSLAGSGAVLLGIGVLLVALFIFRRKGV